MRDHLRRAERRIEILHSAKADALHPREILGNPLLGDVCRFSQCHHVRGRALIGRIAESQRAGGSADAPRGLRVRRPDGQRGRDKRGQADPLGGHGFDRRKPLVSSQSRNSSITSTVVVPGRPMPKP